MGEINKKDAIMQLIPLHVHTCSGSLLDSILKIDDYINWGIKNNLTSLGITNHGTVYDSLVFYHKCLEKNIKPLLGIEVYLTDNLTEKVRDNYHLILYAKNFNGWLNLVKLITISNYEENYFYKPRINYNLLEQYKEDILCLSACIGGHPQQLILSGELLKAEEIILKHKEIFQDDYYLELQEHNLPEEEIVNAQLLKLAQKHNIKTVTTTDAHMLSIEDVEAHEVLLCKNTNSKMSDEKRFKFGGNGYYLQTIDELRDRFHWLDNEQFNKCILTSQEIADKCNVEIKYENYRMPKVELPAGVTNTQYFTTLVKNGLRRILSNIPSNEKQIYIDRAKEEIKIMSELGFQDYMIMLYDVYQFCQERDILMNFSRGSGTAALTLYCLGVTQVDPIKHNLPLSRFINRHRITILDFDCDAQDTRRNEIVEYVRNKYGNDKVCNIVAFGTLKAKGAIKAVATALEYPFADSNQITSIMTLNASIKENLEHNKEFKSIYEQNERFKKIVDIAQKLEGVSSSVSVHPSGIICCDIPLIDICPIVKTKDGYASAFDMSIVESVLKLVKIDFLGLKTLSIVKETFDRLKNKNINITLENINYEDEKVFKMLASGDSSMVFQFESNLMSKLLKDVQPVNIDDLSVVNAIARPASLESGLTQEYIEYRQGKKEPTYLIPEFKEDMKTTYGLCIFQEGLITMASKMSGLGMEFGDLVRVACAKKKADKIAKIKEQFYEGCHNLNRPQHLIDKCFNIIESSAMYGFSACHSVAYSYLSYVTAYLKYYYPTEYCVSILNNSINNVDDLQKYIAECYRLGIEVISPSINNSEQNFTITKDNKIIFGLNAIKGLGTKLCNRIIEQRNKNGEFTSFMDFCTRVKPDKKAITALLESNCFSELEQHPKKWLYLADHLCSAISDYKKNKLISLTNLLKQYIHKDLIKQDSVITELEKEKKSIKGASKSAKAEKEIINEKIANREKELSDNIDLEFQKHNYGFTKQEIRENELQYLSYQITTNPSNIFEKYKKYFTYLPIEDIDENCIDNEVILIGQIKNLKEITTKGGHKMAFATLSHIGQNVGVTIFQHQYKLVNIKNGDYVRLNGKVQKNKNTEFGDFNIILNKINVLRCIETEEAYVQNTSNWTKEQKNIYKQILDLLSDCVYNKMEDINKMLVLSDGEKNKITNSKYWISDINRYRQQLIRYKLL